MDVLGMDLKFVSIDTFLIQTVILLFVLYILNRFVVKPYIAYLDTLEDKQKKLESDYKNIEKLIQEAENKKEDILSHARQKAQDIQNSSQEVANAQKNSIIESAQNEATQIVEHAKQTAQKEKESMLSWVRSQLMDIILKFNKKIFGEEKVSKDYIEKELSKI